MKQYRAVYSEWVAEFILTLPKRRQRRLVDICTKLARHPFITPDYVVKDASGREIEHLMTGGFIIAYWVDVPVGLVMIVEVDDAE
jgi:mRNA-degrading endonuclease RelE of RelBE toxin-antitoxin system